MNLVETASIVKKAVIIFVAVLGLYITFLLIKNPIRDTWLAVFPPDNLPDLAFGLLEPLEFTAVRVTTPFPQYTLFTKDGTLPDDLPSKMPVYKYVHEAYSLFEGEKAQKDALLLGFDDTMRISDLSADNFIWQDVFFGGNLEIDTRTRGIELNTPMANIGSFFPAGQITQSGAIEVAQELLTAMGRFSDKLYVLDIRGTQRVIFGKFAPGGAVEANSILEAQVAKVDFFRKVFEYPILGPNPDEGLLHVTLRSPEAGEEAPQLNFPRVRAYHWEINTDETATYPIIPVALAWQEVSAGNGVISNVTPSDASPFQTVRAGRTDNIIINEIYLAYFDSKEPQEVMQPIYVFEGNYTNNSSSDSGSITVYYPAISGEHVIQPQLPGTQSGQL